MLAPDDGFPVCIGQVEGQPAKLGAFAPVGTASETSLTDITLSAVANTQSPVHKDLQRCVGTGLMDAADFFQAQFACQYHLAEAGFGQKAYLFHVASVCVLAWRGIGGKFSRVMPMSCTMRASTPIR